MTERRNKQLRRERGLTLTEILVVLVIIAVVAGVAVLATTSFGGDPPQERSARRIAALIELASQNAVMEGREYGLEIKPHSYRFLRYDGATWQPVSDDPTFRERHVDDGVTLNLQLEGHPVVLPKPATAMMAPGTASIVNSDSQTTDINTPRPDIVALSSGELTPFDLTVVGAKPDLSYHVRGHMNGKVQLIPPGSEQLNQ
ncbi:MAG TPA: type II secretion system minor pseudopilin GspH [Gammaproteobacteria bacterium]|nr:type II secretion system minor pseudopilin GspH [Gammaproteobacteria bacterium]